MAPLILHNVPDEELYIGDDGVKRPFAMIFAQSGATLRARKGMNETGSFGKSTRRARTKTATPARKEDPTVAAADKVFNTWMANLNSKKKDDDAAAEEAAAASTANSTNTTTQQRPGLPTSSSSQNLNSPNNSDSGTQPPIKGPKPKVPVEVILRGYRSSQQQYAAINHYEQLAGRICEDYPREPPLESRRYKSELRDPGFANRRILTPAEREKVNRADSGQHWVKITFDSAEAADAAIYASPQSVLGHLVYAEPYNGLPPAVDEPIIDYSAHPDLFSRNNGKSKVGTAAASGFNPNWLNPSAFDRSPTSSHTVDTGTVHGSTISSATITGNLKPTAPAAVEEKEEKAASEEIEFCKTIPSARKVRLLPMEQALLPAPSYAQRLANYVPFIKWFNGAMIGSQVPRTDNGEFDWEKASLYWQFLWWLDFLLNLFGGEIRNVAELDE
ncbi:hypothetical protein QBC38DRAFT_352972 [Podospora fimiseda]|uniref:Nucleoporin NUP53 n=1 Tax=Podospora fimiseda TaxID=252190 RepID=A0AAN7H5Z2_9PEZI|nr:hypothetical protein QBC38DRAFT_352972 [Podospora fimiseda]